MAKKKIDVFQKFDDVEMKRMQTVYLHQYNFTPEEIAKWTDYAVSTIKNYIKTYAYLLEKAQKIFLKVTKKVQKVKKKITKKVIILLTSL